MYPEAQSEVSSAPEYYSKAIGRALDILGYFSDSETTLNLTEIVQMSGIPEASLFRILLTLEYHRYLQRNPDGSYKMAPKVLFGTLYEHAENVRQKVHPLLINLNQRFDETVSLAYLFGDKIQVIDVLEAFKEVRATNSLGKLLPPHCSSMAKAITAFQPSDRFDRIIQVYGLVRFTERTIVDRLALLKEYENIRSSGWSMEREESSVGICCFGAPIFNEKQHAVAAISVMCPLIRITPAREKEIIQALVKTSQKASATLQLNHPLTDS
ncbi:MAG: IclR family transcriptional regulator [Acidobacteria bacterium]|nr:IclR family transcriptional regulator [Acidobacteriota bacterium]